MKKTWAVMGTAVAISAMIFTGCGSSDTATSTDTTQESGSTDTAATDTSAEETKSGDFSGLISPISREEGSGTRGAFIELFGIEEKQGDEIRADLQNLAKEKGASYLHHELQKVDKESAEAIHPNNIKRVIRALEYFQSTGQKFSDHNKEERQKGSPYNFLYLVLTMNRKVLYERIDKRVDQMMEEGLVKEVKQLLDAGYSRNLVSMQGLGYKEIASALFKECTMEEAVYRLKRDTRHFAKRQMTWFRRERDVTMINKDNFSNNHEIVNYIMKLAVEKGICLCREG